MTRKRYKWSYSCEILDDFGQDSKTFFDSLVKIRQFFYSRAEIREFPDGLF